LPRFRPFTTIAQTAYLDAGIVTSPASNYQ
jgi:hypothetical protein